MFVVAASRHLLLTTGDFRRLGRALQLGGRATVGLDCDMPSSICSNDERIND